MTNDRWSRVEDKLMLAGIMDAMQSQPAAGGYYPRLWLVLGPDNHVYGYMVTAWDRAVMKVMDEKTLYVYDMPLPPYRVKNGKADR